MSETTIATEVKAKPASCPLERQDCTLVAWYSCLYAPRTGGAYDSHHRTTKILSHARRRGGVAARGAGAAGRACAACSADKGLSRPQLPVDPALLHEAGLRRCLTKHAGSPNARTRRLT